MKRILTATLLGLIGVLLALPVWGTLIASAATGEVTWANPPENTSRILGGHGDTPYKYDFVVGDTAADEIDVPSVGFKEIRAHLGAKFLGLAVGAHDQYAFAYRGADGQ